MVFASLFSLEKKCSDRKKEAQTLPDTERDTLDDGQISGNVRRKRTEPESLEMVDYYWNGASLSPSLCLVKIIFLYTWNLVYYRLLSTHIRHTLQITYDFRIHTFTISLQVLGSFWGGGVLSLCRKFVSKNNSKTNPVTQKKTSIELFLFVRTSYTKIERCNRSTQFYCNKDFRRKNYKRKCAFFIYFSLLLKMQQAFTYCFFVLF